MKKTNLIIGISATVIFLAGIGAVSAFNGFGRGMMGRFNQNLSQEDGATWQNWREAKLEALENNDYNAWKELMAGKRRVSDIVNEQNFSKFAQMHKLMQAGKYEEADKIGQELGLGAKSIGGRGMMGGRRLMKGLGCPMINSGAVGTSIN